MSNYTWPQKCPDLVQDVSLKRARIDNEDGTSTIRTTSSSSTDVTAITQALGNQADTLSQPSVIGLLKNLVANSGGEGGGEPTSYPVFKCSHGYSTFSINTGQNLKTAFYEDNDHQTIKTFPDWTKLAVIIPLDVKYTDPDNVEHKYTMTGNYFSISLGTTSMNKEMIYSSCSIDTSDNVFQDGINLNFEGIRFNDQELYIPSVASIIAVNYYPFVGPPFWNFSSLLTTMDLELFLFDTDPLEISGGGGGSGQAVNTYSLTINGILAEAIDSPVNTPPSTNDKTLATLGSFQKRYQSWNSSIVFTPDTPKTAADLPSGFQTAIYQATEAEFTGTYFGVQVHAKFKLSPNSDETIITNPVVCYNTNSGAYSHTRGFILKLQKTSSEVILTMEQATSIDFGNNDNTFNSYVDSTTTFNVSYIKLKMTAF